MELLWESFETPLVFKGEAFTTAPRRCVWNPVRASECVPVFLQINLPPCGQKYKCEEPSPLAASEDCLHMLFLTESC